MKRNIRLRNLHYLFILIMSLIFAGCEDENVVVELPTPVSLIAPVEGTNIELDTDNNANAVFEWNALPQATGNTTYKVLFDTDNTLFETPVYTTLSDDDGTSTSLTISHALLDEMAGLAGIGSKKSGTIKWAVDAINGPDTITSIAGMIVVKRPTSLGPVPSTLYLTGLATEAGSGIENAIPFHKTASGEFELITSLSPGTYQIVNGKDAERTFYYSVDGELFRGLQEDMVEYSGAESPQIIKVSFNNAVGSISMISSFELIITATHVAEFELDYAGNHKFEANNVVIHYLNPGDPGAPSWLTWTEDRYKFRAITANGEYYYGSYMDASMGGVYIAGMTPYSFRPEGQEPVGFYNVYYVQPNDDFWAGCWKLATSKAGVPVDVMVDFSPNGDYTHSINLSN